MEEYEKVKKWAGTVSLIAGTLTEEEQRKVIGLSSQQIALIAVIYREQLVGALELIDNMVGSIEVVPGQANVQISVSESMFESIVKNNAEDAEQIIKQMKKEKSGNKAKGFAIR